MAKYGSDDRARVVRVYLALVYIDTHRLDSARALLAPTRDAPSGASRDFAEIAEAAILTRLGKPERALLKLEPLSGKVVDPDERYVFGEQIVAALLAAHRYRGAVDQTIAWLAHSKSEDVESAQQVASRMLLQMPLPAVEERLRFLDAESDNETTASEISGARDWLRKSMRERLVESAIRKQDGALARRLLDASPALRASARGEELSRLATSEVLVPNVAGRSIGLVLSRGDRELRRRSADVAAGITRALGLPNSASRPGAVNLLTEDESAGGQSVETALAALAGQGAAVLVAGMDEPGAEHAAHFAQINSIPVILLTPLRRGSGRFSFVIGTDPQVLEAELLETLRTRSATIARVGPGGLPCTPDDAKAAQSRFPIQQWKRERALGLLFVGDAACTRDTLDELAKAGLSPLVALGLDSAELAGSLKTAQLAAVASTGRFPRLAPQPSSSLGQAAPSWYEVLGHDAAVLGAAALENFPPERVEDARAVAELHARARDSLTRVRVELWSTEQSGFSGTQVLTRRFRTALSPLQERITSR